MPVNISEELISAYRSTRYCVFAPSPFSLEVDKYSDSIADLHIEYGCSNSAFITAYNPYSEPTSDYTNAVNNQSLQAMLSQQSKILIPGEGRDASGAWPAEKGYLAVGICIAQACKAGLQFKQNAIITIENDSIPKLRLLR
jgi:hypothetical protein